MYTKIYHTTRKKWLHSHQVDTLPSELSFVLRLTFVSYLLGEISVSDMFVYMMLNK